MSCGSCGSCVTTSGRYTYPTTTTGSGGVQSVAGYKQLGYYNTKFPGGTDTAAPVVSTLNDNRVYMVPGFGGIGYAALQNGMVGKGSGCGYFDLSNAYPNFSSTCGSFTSRLCGS